MQTALGLRTSLQLFHFTMWPHPLQIVIGTGCKTLESFILDYGGPFDCKSVQYLTGGGAAAVLLIVTVVGTLLQGEGNVEKKEGDDTYHV